MGYKARDKIRRVKVSQVHRISSPRAIVWVKEGGCSASFKGPVVLEWDERSHWTNQPKSREFSL